MRSTIGGVIAAILFFAAGAVLWAEARLDRRMATAHERLATLHYDPSDDIDGSLNFWDKMPGPTGEIGSDLERHRTTISYWLSRYDTLSELTKATGPTAPTDPQILFTAANASFRSAAPEEGDKKLAVERLDGVVQAYADVLRKDPTYSDAAYNYEYVSRMRDTLAKAPPSRASRDGKDAKDKKKAAEKAGDVSVDLPTGPTVHGRPGGPPDGTDMSDFKTITPMRYDEREEQMDPGRGKEIRRKG